MESGLLAKTGAGSEIVGADCYTGGPAQGGRVEEKLIIDLRRRLPIRQIIPVGSEHAQDVRGDLFHRQIGDVENWIAAFAIPGLGVHNLTDDRAKVEVGQVVYFLNRTALAISTEPLVPDLVQQAWLHGERNGLAADLVEFGREAGFARDGNVGDLEPHRSEINGGRAFAHPAEPDNHDVRIAEGVQAATVVMLGGELHRGNALKIPGVRQVQSREFIDRFCARVVGNKLHERAGKVVMRNVSFHAGFVDALFRNRIKKGEENEMIPPLERLDGFLNLIRLVLKYVVYLFHAQVWKLGQHRVDHVVGQRSGGIGNEVQRISRIAGRFPLWAHNPKACIRRADPVKLKS